MKLPRIKLIQNDCPKLQGSVGVDYDSYVEANGPVTITFWLYFYGIEISIGQEFKNASTKN